MEGSVKNLFEVEKESRDIIEQANSERTKRLKEAKVYAEQEIFKFRNEMEQDFQKESEKKKEENKSLEALDKQTEEDIKVIKADFDSNKARTMDMLLDLVMNVELDVPQVVCGKFE